MQRMETKALRVKEFAREAGVSVRTLHLYDRLGLLKPAALTASGYRLYGDAELERLEHIVLLRFLGFSLDQIRELLAGPRRPLRDALRMQRSVIERQQRRLAAAMAALAEAERRLSEDEQADLWPTLRNVMEAFTMQNDWEWTRRYYSQEALEKIGRFHAETPRETIEQGERDWSALIADVEEAASRGVDPASDEARALADRWRALLLQFTKGDAEIQRGLNRLWSDRAHPPEGFTRPWSDAADAFIKASMS